jgi:hypothetical protein
MSTNELQILHLGEVHPDWNPARGEFIQILPDLGHFVLSYAGLCDHSVDDFQERGRFGFVRFLDRLVFVFDFGSRMRVALPYFGDPTCACCAMTRTNAGEHRLLSFALVESTSGVIRGLRAATISAHVSERMQVAIDSMPACAMEPNECDEYMELFHRRYPTWSAITRAATMCKLGS